MVIIPKFITMGLVIGVAALFGVDCWWKLRTQGAVPVPLFAKKMWPFYAWLTLSIMWSINDSTHISFAFIRSMLAFEFGIVVAYFCRSKAHFFSILKGFVAGGVASSLVVLYFQHNLIGIKRLGGDIYGSAMEFSGGLIVSIISCIILYAEKKEKKYIVIALLFLILCAFSGSRSALLVPILFCAFFYAIFKQNIFKLFFFFIFLAIFSGLIYIASQKIPAVYDIVGKRIEQLVVDQSEDGSLTERKIMKNIAIESWMEQPLIGYGLYGFGKKLHQRYGVNVFSHCDYTEILSCFGIIGACLFYIPMIRTFVKKRNYLIARNNILKSALLAFLIILVIRIGSSIFFMNVRNMVMISLAFSVFGKNKIR